MILEKAYQYLQYVPYVSYVPAAANLCTKLFVNCHKEPAEVAKRNWFYNHANECSNLRTVLLCLPPFGNLAVFLYDLTNNFMAPPRELICGNAEYDQTKDIPSWHLHNISNIRYVWCTFLSGSPIRMDILPVAGLRGAHIGSISPFTNGNNVTYRQLYLAKILWTALDMLKIVSRNYSLIVVAANEEERCAVNWHNEKLTLYMIDEFVIPEEFIKIPE